MKPENKYLYEFLNIQYVSLRQEILLYSERQERIPVFLIGTLIAMLSQMVLSSFDKIPIEIHAILSFILFPGIFMFLGYFWMENLSHIKRIGYFISMFECKILKEFQYQSNITIDYFWELWSNTNNFGNLTKSVAKSNTKFNNRVIVLLINFVLPHAFLFFEFIFTRNKFSGIDYKSLALMEGGLLLLIYGSVLISWEVIDQIEFWENKIATSLKAEE